MAELAQKPATTSAAPAITLKLPIDNVPRHVVFLHSLFFVLGFTIVFTLTGIAVGLFGSALDQQLLMQIGAIVLVIFALATLGVFRWLVRQISEHFDPNQNPASAALISILDFPNKLIYSERRVAGVNDVKRGWGYLSSTTMGVAFAAGWTPCIGPILGSILFLGMSSQTVWQSAALLLIYSAGLGIPFLITGAAFGSMTKWLRKLNRHAGIVSLISGFFMLYVAFLLWSGQLASLTTQYPAINSLFLQLNDFVLVGEKWLGNVTGTGGDPRAASALIGAILAFSAGLLSFLSPCVLPLVPAYIGYLSGTVVGARPAGQVER
jgi:cytochrome c-type biogenesis protein